MPLMKVTVNGTTHIVDSPDVRTARAWGRSTIKIEVSDATAMDIRNLDESIDIPVLEKQSGLRVSDLAEEIVLHG